MQIIKLKAENIKKLKAIEIIPEGNTVIISGANGQGKTSVLDSIWLALGGADATKNTNTTMPIRDGEERASVTLDLGDIVVTRTWTGNDKTSLKVENAQGTKFPSPQKMLDTLVGRLSFDPLAFSQQQEREQLKTLLDLIKLPINIDELDRQKKESSDQRTIINREVKRLEGQLSGLPVPDEDTPAEEISASEILDKMQEASDALTANNLKRQELQGLVQEKKTHELEISDIKNQIEKLQLKLSSEQEKLDAVNIKGKLVKEEVAKLIDPNITGLQQQMKDVEKNNQVVRDAAKYREVEQSLKTSREESEAFTGRIKSIEQQKENALKEAKFPIDGLGFTEQGVTFNGMPFKQCSSAERLKVSLAMAMDLNPEIRVIRITDGSLLDSGSMDMIKQMAADKNYQVWIEVVDESGSMGVYIEDGEVVEQMKTIDKPADTPVGENSFLSFFNG